MKSQGHFTILHICLNVNIVWCSYSWTPSLCWCVTSPSQTVKEMTGLDQKCLSFPPARPLVKQKGPLKVREAYTAPRATENGGAMCGLWRGWGRGEGHTLAPIQQQIGLGPVERERERERMGKCGLGKQLFLPGCATVSVLNILEVTNINDNLN